MPRWAKVLVGSGVAVMVLVPTNWLIANSIATSTYNDALASVRAAGFSTDLRELAPPPISDDRNAAMLFAAAFPMHPDPDEDDPALKNAIDGRFSDLTAEDKASVRKLLEKSGDLFAKVRSGRRLGSCRYSHDYSKGLQTELPELNDHMLATVRLLEIRAQSEAEAGRADEARESVRDILALAEGYRRVPMLIAQLIRLAVLEEARAAIDKCVNADTSEADLRAWLDVAPGPETVGDGVDLGYQGELAGVAQIADRPMEQVKSEGKELGFLASPYFKITGARYLRTLTRMIQASRKPYLEARRETRAMLEELQEKKSVLDLYSVLLVPWLSKALDQQMRFRASMAVTRAGLEAELRRAATGRYPETIDAIDPFTGKPLPFGGNTITTAGIPDKPEDEKPAWRLRKK